MEFFSTRLNVDFIRWMRPMVIFSVSAIVLSVALIGTKLQLRDRLRGRHADRGADPRGRGSGRRGRLRDIMAELGHGDAASCARDRSKAQLRISMPGSQEENRDLRSRS
jgi:hypothetical protein